MIFQKNWKRLKRVMALILAVTMFVSGWGNYDLLVSAEEELGTTEEEIVLVPRQLTEDMLEVKVVPGIAHAEPQLVEVTVKDEDMILDTEKYTVTFQRVENDVESDVSEIVLAGTYKVTVQAKEDSGYTGIIFKEITVSYSETSSGSLSIGGNTFKNQVFSGNVTVRPPEGYRLSELEDGVYEDYLIYMDSQDAGEIFLQNIFNGYISKVTRDEIIIDETAPSNLTVNCADENVWAQDKEISVSVNEQESGCCLYYAGSDLLADGSVINSLPEGLEEIVAVKDGDSYTGSFSVAETIGSTAKIYYVYAIDDAGNVAKSSVDVSRIEDGSPVISIDENMENFEAGVYWKNSSILGIPIIVNDFAGSSPDVPGSEFVSGIRSVEVWPDEGAEFEGTYEVGDQEVSGILKVAEPGDYAIVVTDQAGNKESKTIMVKQDTVAPEVALGTPNGLERYHDTDTDIHWFSNENVTVPVAIIDTTGDIETEKAPYEVIYSNSQDMSDAKTLETISDEGMAELIIQKEDTAVTYFFQVKDRAGNAGNIKEVKLAYDTTAPVISEVSLPQLGDDEWINHSESVKISEHGLTKVKFSLTAGDAESGIRKIEYSSDNGNTSHTAETVFSGNAYTFTTNEGYVDGADYQWAVRITDNVGNTGNWIPVSGGKIDTAAPNTTAYIKFFSDTAGANDTSRGSVTDGKWISHIFEMATKAWNKIWGKTTVKFEVYVQDETSGIDTISMSYSSPELSERPILSGSPEFSLTKAEGLKAFSEGDPDAREAADSASGYTVFEGEITCIAAEELAARNFRIDSLTDIAGNTATEKIVLGNAENTDIIYLDTVAPELSIILCDDDALNSNPETDILTKEKYFYHNSKKMVLTIDERFFGQENTPVYPTVTLLSRENSDSSFVIADTVGTWTQMEGTLKWQAEIALPAVDDQEMEYQITMSAYADPSGNALVGDTKANHAVSAAVFTSKIYVVDARSPKLVDYHVSDSTVCRNQGIPIYKNNLDENDLTVTFVIDDQEEYYLKSKDQLSVRVYRNQEEIPVLGLTEEELQKEFDGRNHRYSFGFDGVEDTEDAYYVEISFRDEVGNLLADGRPETAEDAEGARYPGTLQNGTYLSEKYIIDHVAPEFQIEFSDAENVVKNGVSNSGKKPLSGHTSYYHGDIQIQITFRDHFANENFDGSLEHFGLKLYKDGAPAPLAGDDLVNVISNVMWEHDGNVHTAEFTLKADPEGHTTDGNYQFVVTYRDCAGNTMISAKDGQENYISPVLVIDTTPPVVTTSYSEEVTRTTAGIDYFNHTHGTFDIKVTDRNIRYGELKKVLQNLRAYDIDGTEIIGSVLAEAVDNVEETGMECSYGNEPAKQWLLKLPLQTEANYEIPVYFTDLAGNPAVVNGKSTTYLEKVTVDATAVNENIYIQFSSDVQGANDITVEGQQETWVSRLLLFISDQWNKLWGRETIRFKIYVRDETSGVERLSMSFFEDQKAVRLSSETDTLKRENGTAILEDDCNYVIFTGKINRIDADDLFITQFQIDEVVDKSGNTRENIWFAGKKINEQIYLDDQPPVLSNVTIDQVPVETDSRYYYHESKQVVLTMEERFMGQEKIPVYPKVVVSSRKTGGTNPSEQFTENPDIVVGKWNPVGDEKWQAVVELTAEMGEEIEYLITIDGYQDGAGHALTGTNVKDGSFTSKIIVIDTLAPEIKKFEVASNGLTPLFQDEGLYFAENIEGDDVKITVTVDDNETYFHPEAVEVFYNTDASGVWVKLDESNVSWENGGTQKRLHTAVYTFDGVKDEEHTYQFKVSYKDRAGNSMVNHGADAFGILAEQGSFVSNQKVVIDHLAPKMTKLLFDTPVQIFDGETNEVNGALSVENKVTDRDSRVYYDSNAKISFDVDDAYLKASDLEVNIYRRDDKLAAFHDTLDTETEPMNDSGTVIVNADAFEFTMPEEDGEYYFTISYTDRAGNQMVYAPKIETKNNAAYAGGIRSNTDTYVSPVIIRDTITPVCEVTYTTDKVASDLSDYYYSVHAVEAVVHVHEMNLDMEATKIYVTAEDINGNRISCPEVEKYNGINSARGKSWAEVAADSQQTTEANRGSDGKLTSRSLKLKFETEARYTVKIEVVDKVKKGTVQEKIFCIDRTVPVITIVDTNGHHTNEVVKAGLLDEATSDITYRVVNDGTFAHIINKLTFGYFAKEKIRVQIKVHDRISGVDRIVYTYTDAEKDEATGIAYQPGKADTPDMETFRMDADDRGCAIYQFDLPISFKGTIKAYGIDMSGNSAENTPGGAIGVIAETSDKHSQTSKTTLEVLSNSQKTKEYYNEDVKIRFTSQDSYSGLYLIDYQAGSDLQETVSYGTEGEKIVTSEIIRDYLIQADSNNENNIKLGLRLEDLAGHETKVPEDKLPKIHIDTTKPVVEVTYDNLDVLNEKYYKDDRTATVTVTERNFDPKDVTFEMEGPEVSVSEWSHVAGAGCAAGNDPSDTKHTDSCGWVCQVHFSEDGDYTFGFRCVDLAGNEGVYDQVDEFVIDKTIPKITVEYDNHSFLNEYYYKEARTATITIEEHNFSANDVELTMTAKDDGNVTQNPGVSGWSEAGDLHTATICYDYDGEFTFDIAYKDLAGNEAEDYEPDHFIVDLTAPELEIFDIEDRSANNGEVRPAVRYFDTNYDPEGTEIVMTGYHTGTVEMAGEKKLQENGMELKLHDFAYEPEMDDLYTMEATVYDLAGNSSEATVQFSVNRFGSVYTFDEATDALIGDRGRYYTNQEQELVITETNVDTLEFQEITCNLNGKLTTLKEGSDYGVSLNGNDSTWKQYTYTIGAHNFTEEGTYILTIYSEDRASNASDNNSKGKKVEFVVDKTKPGIIISGVENNGQYRANSREMTLNVEDNVRLSQVAVSIDGRETVFDAAKIYEADGTFVMDIGSTNHWQEIKVTVTDAAGNEETLDDLRVLVTANMLVQFYRNAKLFYGSLGIIVLGVGLIFARKRRR